jgi:Ca2+-transporting ATPase
MHLMPAHPHRSTLPPSPWSLTTEETAKALGTRESGLTEQEVKERRKQYGDNTLPRQGHLDVATIFFQQFASPLIFVLLVAAGITTLLNEWLDTVVIALAILVNVALGFYQEFRAEHVLEKLTTYVKERARVIRVASGTSDNASPEGIEQEIDSALLVPGDIIRLQYGARVPADARLVSETGLSVDESVLTGESLPVAKKTEPLSEDTLLADRTNMVFAGTLVVEGHATGIVTATDAHTEIGHIAELVTKTEREKTPLQRAIAELAWFILAGVTLLVAGIFFLGISRGEPFLEMLLLASAVAVGAIPEALPIALTVILAIGVERLAARKGIMRSLAAAETLGSATIVMTDKTGTLTQADLRLTAIHTAEELLQEAPPRDTLGELSSSERTMLELALYGSSVSVENPTSPPKEWTFAGQPIETGIVRAARTHDIDVSHLVHSPQAPLLAFNSTNKFSITRHHREEMYIAMGAPDVLLKRSKLSKDDYLAVETRINEISSDGKRLLGIARFPEHVHERFKKGTAHERDAAELTFLGVLVFRDPIRPEAKEALAKIEHLGASVVMVTGDLKGTAVAVARELGWDVHEGNALSGEEVRHLSDKELSANLSHLRIFARVTPEDKLRIAMLYKKRGDVVAMTGDGVNDAPSLKAVDIGVALGSGSDVAKGVADLVLLDNNFKTIVSAIEEGRRMLGNIRKTFAYLLSNCLDEVIVIGGSLLVGLPLPLNPLQIIWVNFFTGSLPALSFAFDQNYDGKSTAPRHGETRRVVGSVFNKEVKILTIGIGTLCSLLLFLLYGGLLQSGVDVPHARSVIFLCFASYVLVIAFSFRSLRRPLLSYPPFSNHVLNWSVALGALLTVVSVTVPALRDLFEIAEPPIALLWIVVAWLIINVALIELAKWGFRSFVKE